MAKSNSTKAKTEPAADEEQVGASVAAPSSTADAVPLPPKGKAWGGTHAVNAARGLNLREWPSFGAAVLEVLPVGTVVQDIDPEGAPAGWLHAETADGKSGFVAARYVSAVAVEE